MNDIGSARFITRLEFIGRELDDLRIQRQERHDDFRRRLDDMKERCKNVTVHRMERLKTEGITIDISTISDVSNVTTTTVARGAIAPLDAELVKSNERARSSDLHRKFTLPQMRMELSFHCRESSSHSLLSEKQGTESVSHLKSNAKYMEGIITTNELNRTKYVDTITDRRGHTAATNRETFTLRQVPYYRTHPTTGDIVPVHGYSTSNDLTTEEKTVDGKPLTNNAETHGTTSNNRAKQNFRRLNNKLSHVMRVTGLNKRRHTVATLSPIEFRPSQVELCTTTPLPEDVRHFHRSGTFIKKPHVLNKTERHAIIRMYSEGSDNTIAEAKRKLRRALITIQSVKQIKRK